MRSNTGGTPDIADWLATNVPAEGSVGIDAQVHTVGSARDLERKLTPKGVHLKCIEGNLVDSYAPTSLFNRPQQPCPLLSLSPRLSRRTRPTSQKPTADAYHGPPCPQHSRRPPAPQTQGSPKHTALVPDVSPCHTVARVSRPLVPQGVSRWLPTPAAHGGRPNSSRARKMLIASDRQEIHVAQFNVLYVHACAMADGVFWHPMPTLPARAAHATSRPQGCWQPTSCIRGCRVWTDRPGWPCKPVRVHKLEHAGVSVVEKLAALARELAAAGADALLVNDLAETAWLTNLRGADVDCNPVFVSYAIVTADGATLFVHAGAVDAEVEGYLKANGVTVAAYDKVRTTLCTHALHVLACM